MKTTVIIRLDVKGENMMVLLHVLFISWSSNDVDQGLQTLGMKG